MFADSLELVLLKNFSTASTAKPSRVKKKEGEGSGIVKKNATMTFSSLT